MDYPMIKVCLVEDDHEIRELTKIVLEMKGTISEESFLTKDWASTLPTKKVNI